MVDKERSNVYGGLYHTQISKEAIILSTEEFWSHQAIVNVACSNNIYFRLLPIEYAKYVYLEIIFNMTTTYIGGIRCMKNVKFNYTMYMFILLFVYLEASYINY